MSTTQPEKKGGNSASEREKEKLTINRVLHISKM